MACNHIVGSPHIAVQVGTMHGNIYPAAPTPPPQIPRQLPVPRLLVDRYQSTARLEHAWRVRQGPLWAALEGPSGVGKTALISAWETAHRDRWADGALYTDLARTSIEATLARWLHALGRPAPDEAEQAAADWRSATATRSLLVLVDNAHTDPDRACHLLPAGSDCAGVATGHRHLAGLVAHGACLLRLGPLPEQATAELITTLTAQAVDAAVLDEAVASCAGHPLTATLTAAYLTRRTPPVQDLDHPPEEPPVTQRIDQLLTALAPDQAHAAVLACLHPGAHLTRSAATALLDSTDEGALEVLETLTVTGLLHHQSPGRWAPHDQVRAHLARRANADQRAQALQRLADHYVLRAAVAEADHLNPWRYYHAEAAIDRARSLQEAQGYRWFRSEADAMAWADSELDNLLPVVEWLCEHRRPEAWMLGDLLGSFLNRRRFLAVSRPLFAASLRSAQQHEHLEAIGLMHRRLGLAHAEDPAIEAEHYRLARQAYVASGHRFGLASTWEDEGNIHLREGECEQADRSYDKAVRLHEEANRPRAAAMQRRMRALALTRLGEFKLAADLLVQAHHVLVTLDPPDVYQMARCATALADLAATAPPSADVQRALALFAVQTGTWQMRTRGAVQRQAEMHEQAAALTEEGERRDQELAQALELYEQLSHPNAERVRGQLGQGWAQYGS